MSSDADLIYNACLRAEKRLEALSAEPGDTAAAITTCAIFRATFVAIRTLREEIGNGLSAERR